jgi:CheY-like chemotaxis protein/two-component sensor histidine kinase
MATSVEHEISNPLTYVQSNVGFLAAGLERVDAAIHGGDMDPELASQVEEMVEVVDEVRLGMERIRQIVSDLNAFARPPFEQRAPVDVREVLQWALRVTAHQVRASGRLVTDLQPTRRVLASEVWLAQVFINLLVNAAHARPEGRSEIKVHCGAAPDGRVFVSVSTAGPDPSPDLAARAPNAGAGLGVSISRALVTALGGEIKVRTARGEGTTLEVLLPPAADDVSPTTPAPGLEAAAPARPRAKVLVIDDDALVGRAIKRVLGRAREVVAVEDPREALRRLEAGEPFDLILCDLVMPGLSGVELYERLKARSPSVADRIVFLTGGAFTGETQQFLDSVSNLRLEKPFDARALEVVVDALLAG